MEEKIKDIKEILELAKEELENNDENITVTLDYQDLKSLKSLYGIYTKIKEKITYYEDLIKTNPEDEEILRHIIQALNEILED